MKIVSIGAGNLSTHLSIALHKAGLEIAQVYSRTETSAKQLADVLHVPYTTDIGRVANDAALYIISVSDDAIERVTERFATMGGLVVHTAGSVPMDIFAGKFKNYGVLYPLQTFSKSRPVDFSEIPVLIEANTCENLKALRRVAETVSRKVYERSSDERMKLHLAAVFACNFVNHLFHISAQIAQDFGVLSPLIVETVHKALVSGNPEMAQTGPAVRNDRRVMQRHIELLASHPQWQQIYKMMSENIFRQSNRI